MLNSYLLAGSGGGAAFVASSTNAAVVPCFNTWFSVSDTVSGPLLSELNPNVGPWGDGGNWERLVHITSNGEWVKFTQNPGVPVVDKCELFVFAVPNGFN